MRAKLPAAPRLRTIIIVALSALLLCLLLQENYEVRQASAEPLDTLIFYAEADTTVKEFDAGRNFGDDGFLRVAYHGTNEEEGALVRFDISALPASAVIDTAVLQLYLHESTGEKSKALVARMITSPWSEMTMTWSTYLTVQPIGMVSAIDDVTGDYKSMYITSWARAWHTGSADNYGLLITRLSDEGAHFERIFESRDRDSSKPRLVITYHVPPTCYTLTRSHAGQGSDPAATPSNSPGCAAGSYEAGSAIALSASPAAGWQVASWSGTDDDIGASTSNSLTMPAADHTVSVTYSQIPSTCYSLTSSHTGQGGDPTVTPANSPGCATGKYEAGALIALSASPAVGWQVVSWSGTADDSSASNSNNLTMPAADHTVSVTYGQIPPTCYRLARSHAGQGSDPVAAPSNSPGCVAGSYEAGALIALSASPATGWQVASWSGTGSDNSTSISNALAMPAANHAVSVTYNQISPTCYSLTRSHVGQGADPVATPSNSSGCAVGEYEMGAVIALSASPTMGWQVASWSGTASDGSTSASNSVTMPAANHAVGVTYREIVQIEPIAKREFRGRVFLGSAGDRTQPLSRGKVSLYGSLHAAEPGIKLSTVPLGPDGSFTIVLAVGSGQDLPYYFLALEGDRLAVNGVMPGIHGRVVDAQWIRFDAPGSGEFDNNTFFADLNGTDPLPVESPELVSAWNGPWVVFAAPQDPGGPPLDLYIRKIEVTQATQCLDQVDGYTQCPDNSLELTAGKAIAVRVYVGYNGGPTDLCNYGSDPLLKGVRVGLSWTSYNLVETPGVPTGFGYWSGPGTPQSFDVPCEKDLTKLRNNSWGSATFIIPTWATANKNLILLDASVNSEKAYQEADYSNNYSPTLRTPLYVRTPLKIKWARVALGPSCMSNLADPNYLGKTAWYMKKLYPMPVDYSQHPTSIDHCSESAADIRKDHNQLLDHLDKVYYAMNTKPDILIGWLPPDTAGCGNGGNAAGAAWIGGPTGWVSPNKCSDEQILAHEVGHALGLRHPFEAGDDPCWPFPGDSQIKEAGFDPQELKAHAGTATDVMGSGGGSWIAPYTWNFLLKKSKSKEWSACSTNAAAAAQAVPSAEAKVTTEAAILVGGRIGADGSAQLDAFYRFESAGPFDQHSPTGAHCIDFRNAADEVLATTCFDLAHSVSATGREGQSPDFSLLLRFPSGSEQVILRQGSTPLATRDRSPNSPVVTINAPAGGANVGDEKVTAAWTASDADGDELRYMVLYSMDGGGVWHPVALDITTNSLEIGGRYWAGSENARIRVLTSDGFNTGHADSELFQVGRKPPLVWIVAPEDGGAVAPEAAIVLEGFASDLEDGELIGASLVWESDRDGHLGDGEQLILPGWALSSGAHEITLTATDSNGQTQRTHVKMDIGHRFYLPVVAR
jgi:hypothetical protein